MAKMAKTPTHVARLRDIYLGRCAPALARKMLFLDLVELEAPELMQEPEWRQEYLASGTHPKTESVVDFTAVWCVVAEAFAAIED